VQTILVVDDEKNMRTLLRALFTDEGYEVEEAINGVVGVEKARERFFDLILLDLKMPRMDGIETLREVKKISQGITVLMMTAYATVETAVEAMKLGAYDYIIKPFNTDELKQTVNSILDHQRFIEEKRKYQEEKLEDEYRFDRIVGTSETMKEIFKTLSLVSPTNATILIHGESGTGKELIARAIHENSLRADRSFITVNCAALPEALLESELFGHEKGAFTSALSRREGRFELANRGTIFLDEIGDLTLTTQAKLLRAIQEKEFERVGGMKTIKVDVRILAATNRNLKKEVGEKRFREDLFYRLNVVAIELPPLRKRKEDIPLLADYFLKKYSKENKREIEGFSPLSLDLLTRYSWPGNIRELENAIERTVIMCKSPWILPEYFPPDIQSISSESSKGQSPAPSTDLKQVERRVIQQTLEEVGGNKSRAAKQLGISRKSLYNKLKEYGLEAGSNK
jgi:two-component system response regulator HydG